jgi:hypothetical protein
MDRAGNLNAECRVRNAEWQKRKQRIPNSTFRIPNLVAPERPASSSGSWSKPPGRGPTRPMLFEHKALAPGPRPKHPGNVKIDELVRSRNSLEFVIPAKAGIQLFQGVIKSLDSGFHRSDDFLEVHHIIFPRTGLYTLPGRGKTTWSRGTPPGPPTGSSGNSWPIAPLCRSTGRG